MNSIVSSVTCTPVIHLDFYWKKRSRPASSPILLSLLLVKRGQGQKIYRILQITKHTRIFFQDQWLPPFSLLATTMLKKTYTKSLFFVLEKSIPTFLLIQNYFIKKCHQLFPREIFLFNGHWNSLVQKEFFF